MQKVRGFVQDVFRRQPQAGGAMDNTLVGAYNDLQEQRKVIKNCKLTGAALNEQIKLQFLLIENVKATVHVAAAIRMIADAKVDLPELGDLPLLPPPKHEQPKIANGKRPSLLDFKRAQ